MEIDEIVDIGDLLDETLNQLLEATVIDEVDTVISPETPNLTGDEQFYVFVNNATNEVKGVLKGTYEEGKLLLGEFNLMVDIIDGKINNIYTVWNDGEEQKEVKLSDYLQTLLQYIVDIKSGDLIVSRAKYDDLGNELKTHYLRAFKQEFTDEEKRILRDNIGAGAAVATQIFVNNIFKQSVDFTSDPQTQIDELNSSISTARKDMETAINNEAVTRQNKDTNLQRNISSNTTQINNINSKIPAQASSTNQLADKDFVNSSISTATATFRGTFTSLEELLATTADDNDYAYYNHLDLLGNRLFDRYKYTDNNWSYEYTLNNSSFTDEQWKAINSGITEELLNSQFIQYVILNVPSTAISGTLTEEQLTLLQSNKENKIILAGEMYEYSDDLTDSGLLVYTHTGQDGANHFYIKSISITVSTRGWTRTIYDMQNPKLESINLGSVVITPIVDEETGESGIRFSIGGEE